MQIISPSHLFVDGPNVDMVLGQCILKRRPLSHERPRWDRVAEYALRKLGCCNPTFVLNGDKFARNPKLYPLFRALRMMNYRVECPRDSTIDNSDPVDVYIIRKLLAAIRLRSPYTVSIISHDHAYAPALSQILMSGGGVNLIGFPEEMSPQLHGLSDIGAEIIDLEWNIGAFNTNLPRPSLN